MILKSPLRVTLLTFLLSSIAFASDEPAWPTRSAGDLAVFVTIQMSRVLLERCSRSVPEFVPKLDAFLENLDLRFHSIGADLLETEEFRSMKEQPVSSGVIDLVKRDLEQGVQEFGSNEQITFQCRKVVVSMATVSDESLKDLLTRELRTTREIIEMEKKTGVR